MYRGRFRSRLHSLRVETCGRCGQGRADRRFQRGASHGQTRAVLCEVTGGGFRPDAPPVHAGAVPERPANRDAAEPRPRHVALPARRHRGFRTDRRRGAPSPRGKISALQGDNKKPNGVVSPCQPSQLCVLASLHPPPQLRRGRRQSVRPRSVRSSGCPSAAAFTATRAARHAAWRCVGGR